ncbi:hypothetical protein MUN81_12585 [Hymenobacter sp. 5317J-9]|uniref:hypothetical protein n=1 Tax=Hymenobacter sp. 5317J-9 TaxID=2932250 RepID=UPI001FD63C8C|nr:hypothetical protein [Hymenobacter sp. 5317J-9]UOQ96094.1 hypothetical protein MUN81_12585 [Hymenobacter sp. 5317J-9]
MKIHMAWHLGNMKNLVNALFWVCISFTSCRTQLSKQKPSIQVVQTKNQTLIGLKGSNFKGTIFTKEYPFQLLFVSDIDSIQRFTPSLEDVGIAENLLRQQLKTINKLRPNQQAGNPVLHRNLPKYFRQYVGFIDKNGDKIIHINFHWNRYNIIDKINNYIYFNDSRINYDSDYTLVMDGGSYYWGINANITQKRLTDLGVNGFG